jgi:3-hydroxybutyrate dehydrogenase
MASKGLGSVLAVAVETARYDITCNALCSGTVHTPAIETRIQDLAVAEGLTRAAAARDTTGAALPIDGGWIAS